MQNGGANVLGPTKWQKIIFLWRYRVFWSLLSCNAVLRIIGTTSSMMHAMFSIIFVAKNHAEWWCQTRKSCKNASSTVMSGGVCALELLFLIHAVYVINFVAKNHAEQWCQTRKWWKKTSSYRFFLGPVHGKCKMLVSVDIANWDVRLGTIKSSGVMLHWDTKYPQKF